MREPLVDIRKEIPDIKVLREHAVPYARLSVVHMLASAVSLLPSGYRLGVREAWRSLGRQTFLYEHYKAKLSREHPNWPRATLRRMCNRFFAPYDENAPPGHSTGGAIDVWLLNAEGEPFDLHGKVERFKGAPTHSRKVSAETRRQRLILHDVMASAGFTNCRDEWWHYSYGDAGWAVRLGRPVCIYGAVSPPESAYVKDDEAFIKQFLANPPF